MALRLVTQRTRTDCGLAVAAMVSRRPYHEIRCIAVEHLGYPAEGPYSTSSWKLRQLLWHCGIETSGLRKFRGFDQQGVMSALLINYHPPRTWGHWVAFERCRRAPPRVLDPGWWVKQPIRRHLGRIDAAYYIAIAPQ